jgi:hypothetical protein
VPSGTRADWIFRRSSEVITNTIDLSAFEDVELVEESDDEEKLNDMSAFETVLVKYGSVIKRCSGQTFIFNEKTGMWCSAREDAIGAWYRMCQDALKGSKYGTQVRLLQGGLSVSLTPHSMIRSGTSRRSSVCVRRFRTLRTFSIKVTRRVSESCSSRIVSGTLRRVYVSLSAPSTFSR